MGGKKCKIPDCIKPACIRGHCRKHYMRIRRYGCAYTVRRSTSDVPYCPLLIKEGYYITVINSKVYYIHRLIVENLLGRKLAPTEIVHHIDGHKRYNAPYNLQLFGSQGEHINIDRHKLMKKYVDEGREDPF